MYKIEIKSLVNTSVRWVIAFVETHFFKNESRSFVMEQSDNEYSS
jgi:hypothetical protein